VKVVTLDIETVSPGWSPPRDDPDKFPPLPEHVPVVIAWLIADSAKGVMDLQVYARLGKELEQDDDERSSLLVLGSHLKEAGRIVTWNGRGFDMPLLNLRALRLGVDWSFWPKMSHRYPKGFGQNRTPLIHHDMMDLLGDQGGARTMPLDGVARLLGLPGKCDISGKDVGWLWPVEPQRVIRYCKADVLSTYLIYLRWCQVFEGAKVNGSWDRAMGLAESLEGAWKDDLEEW